MSHLSSLVSDFFLHYIVTGISPVRVWSLVAYGVKRNLKALVVQFIDQLVVGILMVDIEGSSSWAAVGIITVVEDIAVGLYIPVVDTVIECEHDKLKVD